MNQENTEKSARNLPQVLTLRRGTKKSPVPLKEEPIRVKNLKDAKKLLSRLLVSFQREEVDSRQAKDLAYLISVFIQAVKDAELEERIKVLEDKTFLR